MIIAFYSSRKSFPPTWKTTHGFEGTYRYKTDVMNIKGYNGILAPMT